MFKNRLLICFVLLTCLFVCGCKQNADPNANLKNDIQNNKNESTNITLNDNSEKKPDPPVTIEDPKPSQEPADKNYGDYDNTKYSWYIIRRNDHQPPGTGSKLSELSTKYRAVFLGDTSRKVVYLTFDEGYEYGFTPKILDILKENNVKAAFFITMPYLNKHLDLVERMVNEGHIVGNHSVSHPSLPELSDEKVINEIEELSVAFKSKTGQNMKCFRPPMGEFSERTLAISNDLGYRNIFWSSAYDDWDVNKQKGADYAYKMTMDNIHNGNVLLLHAVSESNTEALDRIIRDLKSQGYSFGTLDEIN
jgi:peptidoglycan-N-acetylmuramic acid deacetylase